ncbi:MAG: hypothetical protein KatS3mg038_2918 [Candidatus Kapaibacterium sp.]|nr:MAG: hypothetical protein KatS3mg038_2918 [Candidatus Kapabacteria bacterium]
MITVSASVVPAIVGVDRYSDHVDAWMKLTKRKPYEPQSMPARIGEYLEPLIVEELATKGIVIAERQVHRARNVTDNVRMYARLDGVDERGRVVEIKTTANWDGTIHDTWDVQVRAQLCAANVDDGLLVVFDRATTDMEIVEVQRNSELESNIVRMCDEFVRDYVLPDKPPPASSTWSAAMLVSVLGSDAEQVELPITVYHALAELRSKIKVLKEDVERYEREANEMLAEIISIERAQKITYNGKTIASIIAPRMRESVDADKLKNVAPDVYEQCKKTTQVKPYVRWWL